MNTVAWIDDINTVLLICNIVLASFINAVTQQRACECNYKTLVLLLQLKLYLKCMYVSFE